MKIEAAVRKYCMDCSGNSQAEVEKCELKDCPLYLFRMKQKGAIIAYIKTQGNTKSSKTKK